MGIKGEAGLSLACTYNFRGYPNIIVHVHGAPRVGVHDLQGRRASQRGVCERVWAMQGVLRTLKIFHSEGAGRVETGHVEVLRAMPTNLESCEGPQTGISKARIITADGHLRDAPREGLQADMIIRRNLQSTNQVRANERGREKESLNGGRNSVCGRGAEMRRLSRPTSQAPGTQRRGLRRKWIFGI